MEVIRKLLALLEKRERTGLALQLLVMVIVAVVEIAGIASIMPFMAVVINPKVIQENELLQAAYTGLGFESTQAFLVFLGLGVLGILVFSNAIKALTAWMTLRFQNNILHSLSRRLLASYLTRPYSFFLRRNTAELGKNILHESHIVVAGVLSPGTTIVSSSLVCLAILLLLIVVSPMVAAVIALLLGGIYLIIDLMARRKLNYIGMQQVEASAQKFKVASEALSSIKELKVLGRELGFLTRFSTVSERHSRNNVSAGLIADLPRYALETVAIGGILLVALYFISMGDEAEHLVPVLAVYAYAGYRLLPALQQLFSSISRLRFNLPALDILHTDMFDGPEADLAAVARISANALTTRLPFERQLELRNVSFRYADAGKDTVRNASIVVQPGMRVGFVGPTGCGKTTIMDLLIGLHAPTSGQIIVDDTVLTRDTIPNWQRSIGYVPQHIYISDDTIARNIAFGVPDAEIDMDAVKRAARIANLDQFIERELPSRYDTAIGEHGMRLSGGQRQRLGIARALYGDPAVLVMDEATSALDRVTEEAVMTAVKSVSRKTTIFLIAHRLETVRDCDIIHVLEDGAITSSDSYDHLSNNSAWFRVSIGTMQEP